MKKVLFLLLILFLAACSNESQEVEIHESLDEDLAIDTLQVVEVIENSIENNQPLDHQVLERYVEVYDEKYNELSDEDSGLFVQGKLIADQSESFTTLESSKNNFNLFKDNILYYIEHGESQEE